MTTDLDTAIIDFSKFWYSFKNMVVLKFYKRGLRVDFKKISALQQYKRMLQSNTGHEQNYSYLVRYMKANYE